MVAVLVLAPQVSFITTICVWIRAQRGSLLIMII